MLNFLADEDLNNRILRGLLRRQPDLGVIRVQDMRLSGADDATILEWAQQNGRVLLTHDVSTMTKFAFARIRAGESIAGIIEIPQSMPVGQAIEDILFLAAIYDPADLENRIEYLPL